VQEHILLSQNEEDPNSDEEIAIKKFKRHYSSCTIFFQQEKTLHSETVRNKKELPQQWKA
jgi:hypothetical protein